MARNVSDELIVTASFKDGKAVAFGYCLQNTVLDSLFAESEHCRKLWELDILRLLSMAVPNAQWVKVSSDSTIRRWRTKDGKVFAYYFADGNYHRHELAVHTAAFDAVVRKTDKVLEGCSGIDTSNQLRKPTARLQNTPSVLATPPCRGLSLSR